MKIEKNGKSSCGDKSRHLTIRYFFIKDVLERENIIILHCPTERMLADFYTKPLQGSLFVKIRDIIMGLAPIPMEECVGKHTDCKLNDVSKDTTAIDKDGSKYTTYADIVRKNEIYKIHIEPENE